MTDQQTPEPEEIYEETTDDAVIAVALKWSAVAVVAVGCIVAGVIWYLRRPVEEEVVAEQKTALAKERTRQDVVVPKLPFTDITREAGIGFVQENGAAGAKLLPETMGGGGAFLDFDNDGDQDILFVNCRRWEWDDKGDEPPATCALYENDGTGRFRDVTAGSGLDVSLYGMGVAVGDFDADGLVDVFLSAVGPNVLLRNEGNGKFRDVTADAGVAGEAERWSSSCGWFDYDGDGDLDLLVCNYVEWSREFDQAQDFTLDGTLRAYGAPQSFAGTQPYLYRNDGDGRFTDVSEDAGVRVNDPNTGAAMAKSLGLCFHDLNADGRVDVMIANDTVQNMLFMNRGDGKFEEYASLAGVAFDADGNARGAMGVDSAYFRNDGSIGIAVGNFSNEMTALYVTPTADTPSFTDDAVSNGIGPVTRMELTFGILFVDIDLDGRLDLFAANGHLEEDINKIQESQHYEQPPQLLWNCGPEYDDEFIQIPEDSRSEDFVKPMVGRGASYADIDGDGDVDLLIFASGQAPRLLRNDQETGNHWLRVRLRGKGSNRDALGATVRAELSDGTALRRVVSPTRSYQSQVELPVTFGLGSHARIERLVVGWPDGSEEVLSDIKADQLLTVEQEE